MLALKSLETRPEPLPGGTAFVPLGSVWLAHSWCSINNLLWNDWITLYDFCEHEGKHYAPPLLCVCVMLTLQLWTGLHPR